jgi:hypothetical protein
MRKINDEGEIRELNIADLIDEFQIDVTFLDKGDIDETEYELAISQYAYVKFGLVLEKVRNQCIWKRCAQKFADFRDFCQSKVNLSIWQVANAIKSAQVAVNLVFLGFTELPRNASQALKMSELSIERLGEVWGKVVSSCEGHKITALAIESQINPDKAVTSETVRLPARVADALRSQAIAVGMTLTEYLEELAFEDKKDDAIEPTESEIEINAEMSAIIDRVEYQWLKPSQIVDRTIEIFDDFMQDLVGKFIPPVRKVSCE